jgi:hypothetical protein
MIMMGIDEPAERSGGVAGSRFLCEVSNESKPDQHFCTGTGENLIRTNILYCTVIEWREIPA